RPTKAIFPAKSRPRVKPGAGAIGTYLEVFGSMNPSVPAPDSQTQIRPAYQRGEWGIDKPRVITSPESTSIRTPPRALFGRQPSGSSVSPSAVTYRGRPLTIPRPFRWQRSEGSSAEMNDGRHRGVKLAERSSVQRQENRVLTTHNSPSPPTPLSPG